jgi:hypothetical protein
MKSADHIHFLSELLYQVDQLLTLVRDYCDDVVEPDDENTCHSENIDCENMPF